MKKQGFGIKLLWIFLSAILSISTYIPVAAQSDSGSSTQKIFIPMISTDPYQVSSAGIYYLSPTGNDNNDGKTPAKAWLTFNRAWKDLYPGDTFSRRRILPKFESKCKEWPIRKTNYNSCSA